MNSPLSAFGGPGIASGEPGGGWPSRSHVSSIISSVRWIQEGRSAVVLLGTLDMRLFLGNGDGTTRGIGFLVGTVALDRRGFGLAPWRVLLSRPLGLTSCSTLPRVQCHPRLDERIALSRLWALSTDFTGTRGLYRRPKGTPRGGLGRRRRGSGNKIFFRLVLNRTDAIFEKYVYVYKCSP